MFMSKLYLAENKDFLSYNQVTVNMRIKEKKKRIIQFTASVATTLVRNVQALDANAFNVYVVHTDNLPRLKVNILVFD